jgi:hypothetical protein
MIGQDQDGKNKSGKIAHRKKEETEEEWEDINRWKRLVVT